jgi:hypothetical protein
MSSLRRFGSLHVLGCAFVLGLIAVSSAGCAVGVDGEYPEGYYGPDGAYDDYPPDAYIATTDPVYFDGHASYWYGNRWYWRDGGHWNHYDHEPAGLYSVRMHGTPAHRMYEPHRGGGGHGGHGGFHGGGGHHR